MNTRRSERGFVWLAQLALTAALGLLLPALAMHHAPAQLVGPRAICVSHQSAGCPKLAPAPPPLPVVAITTVRSIMRLAARDTGVSFSLLQAVAIRESALSSNAVSSAGAVGVLQTLPAVARENGCSQIRNVRCEAYAGARYLAHLLDRYHGDRERALAAYNAGPGAVEFFHGVPPYAETRAYVSAVLADAAR